MKHTWTGCTLSFACEVKSKNISFHFQLLARGFSIPAHSNKNCMASWASKLPSWWCCLRMAEMKVGAANFIYICDLALPNLFRKWVVLGCFGFLKIGWLIVLPMPRINEGAKKLLETSTFPRGRVFHKKVRERAVIDSMWGLHPICLIIGISNW